MLGGGKCDEVDTGLRGVVALGTSVGSQFHWHCRANKEKSRKL